MERFFSFQTKNNRESVSNLIAKQTSDCQQIQKKKDFVVFVLLFHHVLQRVGITSKIFWGTL